MCTFDLWNLMPSLRTNFPYENANHDRKFGAQTEGRITPIDTGLNPVDVGVMADPLPAGTINVAKCPTESILISQPCFPTG